MSFNEGALAQGLSSQLTLAYSLKGWEPVILSTTGKICLWWRSAQMEAYEEMDSHTLIFFSG